MRKTLFHITLLCLLAVSFCTEIVSEKPAGKKEVEKIVMTKEEIDAMASSNEKAEAIFNDPATKDGRDSSDDVLIEERLYVKYINSEEPSVPGGNTDGPLKIFDVLVNKWTITFYTESVNFSLNQESYRGIQGAVALDELVKQGDVPSSGNCCGGVSDTSMRKLPHAENGAIVSHPINCFEAEGTDEGWIICSVDPLKIAKFRQDIIIAAIKASFRKRGILNVNILVPSEDISTTWTWMNQEQWPEVCSKGKFQSPIDLDPGRSKVVSWMSLSFGFKESDKAKAVFDGHETYVTGDFGSVSHKLEIGVRRFQLDKIFFKFPSEHTVGGANTECEVVCQMTSKDGELGYMSFLLTSDDLFKVEYNTFIENLETEKWDLGNEDGIQISKKPNLDDIITYKEGDKTFQARQIFRRSFFWYMGSATTPPCKEEVYRFVFSQIIYVPSAQLHALKEKTYLNELESTGNIKRAHQQDKRISYYHVDNGKKCVDVNLELASLEPGEAEELIKKKKKDGTQYLDLSHIKPTYLKASAKTVTYGYTGNYNIPPLNELFPRPAPGAPSVDLLPDGTYGRQGLWFNTIPKEEVPFDTRVRLLKKAQEVINKVNNGDESIHSLLEPTAPAIVVQPFGDE